MLYYAGGMKLIDKARASLDGVQDASEQVIETTQMATVALVTVAAVSILALLLAVVALLTAPVERR